MQKKYVRYRTMTFEEQEAKAKELGIKSPFQMMQAGEVFLDQQIKHDYDSQFMVKEMFDEMPPDNS